MGREGCAVGETGRTEPEQARSAGYEATDLSSGFTKPLRILAKVGMFTRFVTDTISNVGSM